MPIETIPEIVRFHGAQRPDAVAIEYQGRSITFGELDERSNRLAVAFSEAGVGERDRVAFLDKNSPEYFEVLFALGKINAVAVAVNWRLAPVEIAQIVNDAEAKAFVVGAEFFPAVEKVEADIPTVGTTMAIGEHPRWARYEQLIADQPSSDPGAVPAGDDIALQLYTSGTTGLPKGVMLTQDNFFKGVMRVTDSWRFGANSVNLALMPMFHIAGSGWSLVGLTHGCRLVLEREVDPSRILRVIPEFGVTNAFMVPVVIQMVLSTPGADRTDFSTLRALVYGASPITDAVLHRAIQVLGCEMIQVYGLTETTGAITQLDDADHDPVERPQLLRSIGKPYPWVEVRIVDPDMGQDVGQGDVGELWTRSRQNMAGYWANDVATRAAITPDGWLKTGDAGYRNEDGYLFLHDRVKDMIVSGGENVYPAEVENVLADHPAIADVAVVGVPDEHWGEAVKAVAVLRPGASASGEEIIAFARERLGGYKLPKSVDFTDALPRNPSGKLLKREIRAPYWESQDRQIN
jgi:long-chain acyl-CoA synthetase